MKKFLPLLILFVSLFPFIVISQSCLPDGITFSTQAEIDNFKNAFPDCIEIEGSVEISGNDITNFDSLHQIVQIDGTLEVYSSPNLINIEGLSELVSIEGRLVIANTSLANLYGLENLESIGVDMYIEDNPLLTNMTGLSSLLTIHSGLFIKHNVILTNLVGMEALTNVGGSLNIESNDLISSLLGLENVDFGPYTDIWIYLNPVLTECEIASVCNYLENQGIIYFSENMEGCNSMDQVLGACGTSVDDVEFKNKMILSPNPFTTSTTLSYELKQPEMVTLNIYNHLGQLIYQTQENQPQGNQTLLWNTEKYADGIYYYRLQAGDEVANGKMVKVR